MQIQRENYFRILKAVQTAETTLVAVSKTKSIEAIKKLYDLGQRDFGENYVQELVEKQAALPGDVRWHFIGHLQTNKVKYIAPFIHLVHSIDSFKLLKEVNKQAAKNNRIIHTLLQVHIAKEETKFGFNEEELVNTNFEELHQLKNVRIAGLMGMASFSNHEELVRSEFRNLKQLFEKLQQSTGGRKSETTNYQLKTLSMGMSTDYKPAIEEGSNMVRIGSLLFGSR